MTDMRQPRDKDAGHPLAGYRPPEWVIVTWVNEELRDRIKRNGAALADMTQATNKQISEPLTDPQLEDREAEP
jgi:hypothetical protein